MLEGRAQPQQDGSVMSSSVKPTSIGLHFCTPPSMTMPQCGSCFIFSGLSLELPGNTGLLRSLETLSSPGLQTQGS